MSDLLRPKLENIISGCRINPDDADWLRGLLGRAPSAPQGGGEVVAWDNGSPCMESRPIGMVYPVKPAPRASGYLDSSGVEWNAYDTGQMEAYARAAYSDGWGAGYRAALAQPHITMTYTAGSEETHTRPLDVPAQPRTDAAQQPIRLRVIFPDGLVQFANADVKPGWFESHGCTVLPIFTEEQLAAELKANERRYTAPPSAPVGVEGVDAAAWNEVLELPEGFRVAEHLPGVWEYQFEIEDEADDDSDRKVSGTSWNHPALAAIAAWQHAYDAAIAQQPAAVDGARRIRHELCDCPNGRAEHARDCAALAAQPGDPDNDR